MARNLTMGVAAALIAVFFISRVSPASARTHHHTYRTIIILAGQSNALGADSLAVDGKTNYLKRPFTNGADRYSTIYWVPEPYVAAPTFHTEDDGQVPLDTAQVLTNLTTFASTTIFGPEIGWARQLYHDKHEAVSVIKDAVAETSLPDWMPGNPDGYFSGLVRIVKATIHSDARKGQIDTIGAVAWYQGESDTQVPTEAKAYQANLSVFIGQLRSRLPMAPTTPIVLVKESLAAFLQICTTNCGSIASGDLQVRAADNWAAAHLPHVVEVDSLGLPRTPSSFGVHLSNVGELMLGQKIAQASEKLMTWPTPPSEAGGRG